jgi:hypothetical protein
LNKKKDLHNLGRISHRRKEVIYMGTALLTATGFALDLTSVNGKSHGASPGSGISQDFAKLLTSLVDHMQTGAANDPGKTAALSDNQPKKKTAPAMDGLHNI